MKKPEQRAQELYPNNRTFCGGVAQIAREAYVKGCGETIDRAISWLKEHSDDYIVNLTDTNPDAPFKAIVGGMCWEYLRKAMEEEQ